MSAMSDLAEGIRAHLRRFEADPEINKRDAKYKTVRFYSAGAYYHGGAKVSVTYISYQGSSNLSKAEATRYLAWLDAGNVGRHFEAFREPSSGGTSTAAEPQSPEPASPAEEGRND